MVVLIIIDKITLQLITIIDKITYWTKHAEIKEAKGAIIQFESKLGFSTKFSRVWIFQRIE